MTAQITTNQEVLTPASRPIARLLPKVARILMGLSFLGAGLFGLAIVTGLIATPQPPTPQPEAAASFFGAVLETGYLLPFIKLTETTVGMLLLTKGAEMPAGSVMFYLGNLWHGGGANRTPRRGSTSSTNTACSGSSTTRRRPSW